MVNSDHQTVFGADGVSLVSPLLLLNRWIDVNSYESISKICPQKMTTLVTALDSPNLFSLWRNLWFFFLFVWTTYNINRSEISIELLGSCWQLEPAAHAWRRCLQKVIVHQCRCSHGYPYSYYSYRAWYSSSLFTLIIHYIIPAHVCCIWFHFRVFVVPDWVLCFFVLFVFCPRMT